MGRVASDVHNQGIEYTSIAFDQLGNGLTSTAQPSSSARISLDEGIAKRRQKNKR